MIYIENTSTFCGISLRNGDFRSEQVWVSIYKSHWVDQMMANKSMNEELLIRLCEYVLMASLMTSSDFKISQNY